LKGKDHLSVPADIRLNQSMDDSAFFLAHANMPHPPEASEQLMANSNFVASKTLQR
jgi:hypothetical protein